MHRDDKQPADAMFWYVLDPAHHGQGYATEAARALLAYSFGELGLHRVWADVDPRNPASMRVCERLGMRKEAHHIENVFIRDEWCDTVIYAMLRREWHS
jgi:RimJ/RimL family protein N-acetyltransferase